MLKKLFILTVAFISACFFYDTYHKYSIIHENKAYGTQSILSSVKTYVTFEQSIYNQSRQFVLDMADLAEQYDIDIIKSDFDPERQIYNTYLYTHHNITEMCDAVVDEDIDFSSMNERRYYSSIPLDDNALSLFSIGNSMTVNIRPLSYLIDSHSVVGDYYLSGDESNISMFCRNIEEKYKIVEMDNMVIDIQDEDVVYERSSLNTTLLCMGIIMLVLITSGWLINNKKAHAIYRLNGISLWHIIKDYYMATFIEAAVAALIIPAVCFGIFIGRINIHTEGMISDLFISAVMLSLSVAGIALLTALYLRIFSTYEGLKKHTDLNIFMKLNFLCKVVSLLLLVPICIDHVGILSEEYSRLSYLKNQYSDIESYTNIYRMDYHYQDMNYSLLDVSNGVMNDSIREHQRCYDILEDNGAIRFRYAPVDETMEEYIVNYQYLSQFDIKDINGKRIELNLDTSDCYVLVPESLKDIDISQFMQERDMVLHKVVINDVQEHMKNLNASDIETPAKHAVLFVYGKQYNIASRNPYTDIYINRTINEVDELLKGTRFEGTLKSYTLKDYVRMTELRSPYFIFINAVIIFMTGILIAMILYEFYCFYMLSKMKETMIKKTLGFSKTEVFKMVILEMVICYVPVMVLCHKNMIVPAMFMMFDALLHIYMCCYIYNVKTIHYLKGGS